MSVKIYLYILISFLPVIAGVPLLANHHNRSSEALSAQSLENHLGNITWGENPLTIFSQVETAILSGSVQGFSGYLSKQVYINLQGDESGYFSANQATYLLRSFFNSRRVVRFKFTTINETAEPYATGGGVLIASKGGRESFQVYVALSKVDNRWVVSQFNVY